MMTLFMCDSHSYGLSLLMKIGKRLVVNKNLSHVDIICFYILNI